MMYDGKEEEDVGYQVCHLHISYRVFIMATGGGLLFFFIAQASVFNVFSFVCVVIVS